MRRAIVFLTLIACLTLVGSLPSRGASPRRIVNSIGMIDYNSGPPNFRVGDWVQYRVNGENSEGEIDEYIITILIAGEERFWGEDCFWLETRTIGNDAREAGAVVTLMSYAVFDDSLADQRVRRYMRKSINDMTEDGTFRQDLVKRPPPTLKNRKAPENALSWDIDTLGRDTVNTPMGLYQCIKVKREEGLAVTGDVGDSSSRTEKRDIRTVYYADGIPITRFAREHIVNTVHRNTWPIGRSSEGKMQLIALSEGNARLIGYGSGLESVIVPAQYRKSLREQGITSARNTAKPARSGSKR